MAAEARTRGDGDTTSFRSPTYDALDRDVEKRLQLPAGLLSGIRTRGERSDANQVSSAGARSVYQIIPATRASVLKKYGVDAYASPQDAALAAGHILKEGLDRNGGSARAAVAEYHGGTDRRNHGPITRSYVGRVSGGDNERGPSTYDRVKVRQRQDEGPSLAKVYTAYRAGQMAPEQAAQFEHDVNAGAILLPPGGKLRHTPAAPTLPGGVVKAYNDHQSGMTIEQRRQIDGDLSDGVVSLPRGARLQAWREMTTGENVSRALGLGTRAVIEGVGDIAGLVMNPLNTALNATGIPQKIAGAPLPMANDPGVNIPDMLGMPRPQFDNERMLSAVERGATTGLGTFGAASMARTVPGAIGTIGRALSAAPVTDIVAGGTSAGSAEGARQAGFGPVGQFVAGVVGGGVGIGSALATERAATRLGRRSVAELPASTPREVVIGPADELTEEGQELIARHGFTPDEIKQAYGDTKSVERPAGPMADVETPASNPPTAGAVEPPVPPTSASLVRRHEGVDYPVEIVGPEQADAAGRIHVQVRGADTGQVGFVPKDELFPVPSAPRSEPVPPAAAEAAPAAPSAAGGTASSVTQRTAADRTQDAEALDIPLTRGQATQDWAIQDTEQTLRAQATGDGDKARTFLVDQADKIKTASTKFREAFGPVDVTKTERGQLVKDAVRELRDQGKAGVSALYREAEAMGGNGIALDHSSIVDAAKRVLVEADVPDAVKNVVRQEMARYNLIGKDAVTAEDGLTTVKLSDGRKVQFYGDPEQLTVGNAEAFRKAISAQYMVDGPRKLSQSIKGAIDDAVEGAIEGAAPNGVEGPVGAKLQEARRAVVAHKETFAAKDVVQKLVDWRKGTKTDVVLPDHAIRDVLLGDVTNLKKMKAVLLSKPTVKSRAAWQGIQAEAVGTIFDKAYVANTNLGGGSFGTVSGAKLNSEIIRFGIPKLKVLLDQPDFDRLMKLRRVIGEATVPIQNTTNQRLSLQDHAVPWACRYAVLGHPVRWARSGCRDGPSEAGEGGRGSAAHPAGYDSVHCRGCQA